VENTSDPLPSDLASAHAMILAQRELLAQEQAEKSWLGESGQQDKWPFCLTAAMIAAHRERS